MDENKIRSLARKESQDVMQGNFRSGTPKVPPHVHDGVSNLRINTNQLDRGKKFSIFVEAQNPPPNVLTITGISRANSVSFYGIAFDGDPGHSGTLTSTTPIQPGQTVGQLTTGWGGNSGVQLAQFSDGEERIINLTHNSSVISWSGGLVNQVGPTITLVAGNYPFKASIYGNAQLGNCFIKNTPSSFGPSNIIQISNSVYIDSSGSTPIIEVGTSSFVGNYLAMCIDENGNIPVAMQIVSWSDTQITLNVPILQGTWRLEGSLVIS